MSIAPESSMIGIGLDFGTTNSTVAVWESDRVTYVDLDPVAANPKIMPSALYLDRAMGRSVGAAAIDRYLGDNRGRIVRLQRVNVGQIAMTFGTTDTQRAGRGRGDTTRVHQVSGYDDTELPGRLFRGLKSFLGVAEQSRFKVFHRSFHIVALITLILAEIRSVLERAGYDVGRGIHVGRPVRYVGGGGANEVAVRRMATACRNAGFDDVVFYPEPVAAGLSYLRAAAAQPDHLLTFDFGGGTLDLCLLSTRNGGFEVVATRGLPIGGNHVDQQIMRSVVFPELGEGCAVKSSLARPEPDSVFPFFRYQDYLLNWQTSYMSNRPELMEGIFAGIRSGPDARRKLTRLWKLIRGNSVYALLSATEAAKAALSERETAEIRLDQIDLRLPFDRARLEQVLQPALERVDATARALLDQAGLTAADVDQVVCTGGSSQLAPVQGWLRRTFPGRVEDFDYYRSIAGGLAIANAGERELAAV